MDQQGAAVAPARPPAPGLTAVQPYSDDLFSNCSEPRWLPVQSLLPADSPRQAGENVDHMRTLASIDDQLPAIIVHRATMRVIDGMHRLGAARLRGDDMVQVRFFEGTEQDAFVLAVRTNIAHGLPLAHEDRCRAAERVIGSHPNWSDRAIATVVGLGARTIGNIRHRMQRDRSAREAPVRTGRDGRTRPVNTAEGRRRASELLIQRPHATLREIAREAGISASTVRDVRLRLERGDDPLPAGSQRRDEDLAEVSAEERAASVDLAAMLEKLQNDPALRLSDPGRDVLRWIFLRAIRSGEWDEVVDKVPPHCTYTIANLARACADEWRQLANDLEDRDGQQA